MMERGRSGRRAGICGKRTEWDFIPENMTSRTKRVRIGTRRGHVQRHFLRLSNEAPTRSSCVVMWWMIIVTKS